MSAAHDSAVFPAVALGTSATEASHPVARLAKGAEERIRSIVAEHYAFLWRSLRRLGVREADVEDAAQRCLLVVAARIDDIVVGKEKTFLFGVVLRVAKSARRSDEAEARVLDGDAVDELPALGPDAAAQLDDRRALAILDAILGSLPLDLRTVFVLYELEELTMAEIAQVTGLAAGTVASRLRRARRAFETASLRVQSRLQRRPVRR
jgi:RNA polymerase sigma-70 factor (ECF subfamily)